MLRSISNLVAIKWIVACGMPVYPEVKTVHVINSCHLDIGFADSSAGIINRYFDEHIPLAISVGERLRNGVEGYTDNKLNFMFQSWVIDMYFDCVPGLGLHCPSDENKTRVKEAIAKGDITWHAFPFNSQLEVMDPALIKAGLAHTFALDAKAGQKRKRTLSQRDVPGMTRSAIPILKSMGVDAISVGQNGGSPMPDTPPCFIWRDPMSNQSIFYMRVIGYGWWGGGHGCEGIGMEHGIVLNFNGDNAGPLSAEAYATTWKNIAKQYPNAHIYASTFDNFTQHLPAFADKLPVVDKEIGDTWVYGVPSDPQKVSRMRVINRAYSAIDAAQGIENALAKDPVLRNATRFALKNGEHTWGKDVKSYLFDNDNWKNADFERARRSSNMTLSSQYATLESSWWEQRHWGITAFAETLSAANHPLAKRIQEEFARLQPELPSTQGFEPGKVGQIYTCGAFDIGFDTIGSINHLVRRGLIWATSAKALMQLKYRSYSADDVAEFLSQYCHSNKTWIQHDYGKPGLPHDVAGKVWVPSVQEILLKSGQQGCSFVLHIEFEGAASREYGAAAVWSQIDVFGDSIKARIGMFNKSSTRIPESMFVQFAPAPSKLKWAANKLSEWVDVAEVVSGGNKHLDGIMEPGLRIDAGTQLMSVSSLDAAVSSLGDLSAYPAPVDKDPDIAAKGASFVLWDNLWGTNYVMWWPFMVPPPGAYASSGKYFPSAWNSDVLARFELTFEDSQNATPISVAASTVWI